MKKPLKHWTLGLWLWLLTNFLGLSLSGAYFAKSHKKASDIYLFVIVGGAFAALCSLPTIPLAASIMPRLMRLPDRPIRQLSTFAVITGFWAATIAFLIVLLDTSFSLLTNIVSPAITYYASAILATCLVFRKWLFESNS